MRHRMSQPNLTKPTIPLLLSDSEYKPHPPTPNLLLCNIADLPIFKYQQYVDKIKSWKEVYV